MFGCASRAATTASRPLEVQIIHQDAYTYAAIGGPDETLGQDPAGGVRVPR